MSIVEKLILGLNTTVIGMGIVFLVLIVLSIIVAVQSKLVMAFFKGSSAGKPEEEISAAPTGSINKTGIISGETVLVGVDDEETVALIMAIVSQHVNIPLNEIKFKSIKAV
jgi:Na+-transporting methylmalonyl-CoA/oxaloacetate decarboxylase gamma subunit